MLNRHDALRRPSTIDVISSYFFGQSQDADFRTYHERSRENYNCSRPDKVVFYRWNVKTLENQMLIEHARGAMLRFLVNH